MITIPNLLSLGRACVVPAFILLFDQPGWAIGLFVGAMITDALDGTIARWTDAHSTMGMILDPVADKLLLVSAFVMLTRRDVFPGGWLTFVLARDLFIVGGWTVIYLLTQQVLAPTTLGKAANVAQTTTVFLYLIPWRSLPFLEGCGWLMMVITAASWGEYLWRGLRILRRWRVSHA